MIEIDECTRDEIISFSEQIRQEKEQEIKILDRIIHYARYTDPTKLKNNLISFVNHAERNFLNGKRLALLINEGKSNVKMYSDELGTTDEFPSSLSYDGIVYEFYIPPIPSIQTGTFIKDVGRFTGLLIKKLIKTFEADHGKIKEFISPVVVIEYGISGDESFARLYDADNRDSKKAIDALTGTFFQDDNVLSITTVSVGTITDEPHTSIYVMEELKFPEWFQKRTAKKIGIALS